MNRIGLLVSAIALTDLGMVSIGWGADGATRDAIQMAAQQDATTGQVVLAENGAPILQYHARTVEPPAGFHDRIQEANRRYARPRSGYVHPLYGPDGEPLTADWSVDHPHHRGIYWAWPEVAWHDRTGDLHALQDVYSRPVGDPRLSATDAHARVEAHNLWLWEDETPIVFERVIITAHALDTDGVRAVDLEVRLEALVEGVTLARRGTDLYGGLNTRLAPVTDLVLERHADPAGAVPRRAWSTAHGTWEHGRRPVTLAILEHPANPDYPGDWITYEELPWFQPAFPKAGTRHALVWDEPTVLRYRLLITPDDVDAAMLARAFDAFVVSTPDPFVSTGASEPNDEKEGEP